MEEGGGRGRRKEGKGCWRIDDILCEDGYERKERRGKREEKGGER